MNRETSQWLIPALLAIAAAAALWYYWLYTREPAEMPEAAPVAEEPERPEAPAGPAHPITEPQPPADRSHLRPLPPLEDSDEYFRLEMAGLFGDRVGELLVSSRVIERIVATVDNLPRAHVAERIRPVERLDGDFLVDGQDGSGEFTMSPDNHRRYDALVNLATAVDVNALADAYRRYYPLFQKAYRDLGYPNAYFNDRLIEVIDHLLQTPGTEGPVALTRPHVLYQYADPELEARSSGQKLLMRMGNEHAARIKAALRALRERIVAE
ncbi:MAG: DUF3014 domain-containing protein [Woeseiaceae bacterium]